MGWATAQEVEDITGTAVTEAELAQADAVVTIYSNRTEPADAGLRVRDLYWLKQAVAWQTVWQASQPGYTTRSNAVRVDQDGVSVERDTEHSMTLAPLAARSLKNLSWKASGTKRTHPIAIPTGFDPLAVDYTKESSDDLHSWEPL